MPKDNQGHLMDFKNFMKKFEKEVLLQGIASGHFRKEEEISIRPGKLSMSKFGRVMGQIIDSDEIFVIDYYGLQKKSRGFFDRCESIQRHTKNGQVKKIRAPVVHFGSIKIETLASITKDVEFLGNFLIFKNEIISIRWGK